MCFSLRAINKQSPLFIHNVPFIECQVFAMQKRKNCKSKKKNKEQEKCESGGNKRGRHTVTYDKVVPSSKRRKRSKARSYLRTLAGSEESYQHMVTDLIDWKLESEREDNLENIIMQLGENIATLMQCLPQKSELRNPILCVLSTNLPSTLMRDITSIPDSTIRRAKTASDHPDDILFDCTTKVRCVHVRSFCLILTPYRQEFIDVEPLPKKRNG